MRSLAGWAKEILVILLFEENTAGAFFSLSFELLRTDASVPW